MNKGTYEGILERVNKRLQGWKSKCLSFAARTLLVKIVVATIPIYAMQTSWLPSSLIDKIEKKIKGFIGNGDSKRQMHLMNWDSITQLKRKGGLGIRKLR